MKPVYTLKINKSVNWGTLPIGTQIKVLDDNTPLNQSYRCVPVLGEDKQVFGITKMDFFATVE